MRCYFSWLDSSASCELCFTGKGAEHVALLFGFTSKAAACSNVSCDPQLISGRLQSLHLSPPPFFTSLAGLKEGVAHARFKSHRLTVNLSFAKGLSF